MFVSDQLPIDAATGEFAGEDIRAQTRQSLENIRAILKEAGLTMGDVCRTAVLPADIGEFGPMNEVYAGFFTAPYPARGQIPIRFAARRPPPGAVPAFRPGRRPPFAPSYSASSAVKCSSFRETFS